MGQGGRKPRLVIVELSSLTQTIATIAIAGSLKAIVLQWLR